MFDKLIFVSLALQLAWASQTASRAKASPASCNPQSPDATSCAPDSCNVVIEGQTFCSKCTGGKVPVNGECKAKGDAPLCTAGANAQEGTCTACTGAQRLYMGGCYDKCPYGNGADANTCADAPAGPASCNPQSPDATSCAPDSCNVVIEGQTFCSKCTGGKVPVNGECKAKGDAPLCTAGANAQEGTCTACTGAQRLYMGGCYDKCPYGNGADANTCADAPAGPASCNPQSPDATSCAPDSCNVVIEGQTFCSKCTGGKVPVNGECKAKGDAPLCTAGANAQEGTCTACTGAQRLYMGGCYDKCPYGNGADANTCADAPAGPASCNPQSPDATSCAPDSCNVVIEGQTFCSKCTGGKVPVNGECKAKGDAPLCTAGANAQEGTCTACTGAQRLYMGGCYDKCPYGNGADANTCADAPAGPASCNPQSPDATSCAPDSCNVVIEGQTFCSKCTGGKVPVNGECKAKGDAPLCTAGANAQEGTCTACTGAQRLYMGGCYDKCPYGNGADANTCADAPAGPASCNPQSPDATSCAPDSCNVVIEGQTFCSKCTGGKVPVNGECKAKGDAPLCTAGANAQEGTCTACTGAQRLYMGGCYDKCPYGNGADANTCADAPAGPASCNPQSPDATSCAPDSCNVVIEGQTFCSKCTGGKVPVNGECKAKGDAPLCTAGANAQEGTCTACTGAQRLYMGGCYDKCPYGNGADANTCADAPAGPASCNPQSPDATSCAPDSCNVVIEGQTFCSKCTGGKVPVNGECKAKGDAPLCTAGANAQEGTCTACTGAQRLYMGGCYDKCPYGNGADANTCADAPAGPASCNPQSPDATSCAPDSCNVVIEGQTFCSKCTGGKVPVNGECKAKGDAPLCTAGANAQEGTCTACTGAQRLYMGGCYDKCPYGNGADANTCADAPAGPASCNPQSPDATSCAPDSCNVVIEGQTFCSKCTGGKVPVNGECKAKGDAPLCTAGANAQEGTCTACTGAQRLYMGGCYDKCPYGNGADANTCADAPAGPASCNPQSPDATSCAPDSCNVVIEGQTFCSKCTGGKVPVNGECKAKGDAPLCTAGANAQEGTCAACTGAQRLYMGGCYDKCPYGNGADANTCADAPAGCNTPNCKACDNPKTDNEVCTECNDGNYLTPTSQCVSDCTTLKGYYGDDSGKKTCKKCNDACAECKGADANQCTACPAGKMLQYTDENSPSSGTCVDGCKPQSGASGCEICGATIGGTKYCSKCSTSTEVPVNGVCKADNARAPVCSKKDNQGGCATCASGYFRQDNGCYKTDRQPGIQICTLASSAGKCETCANSLQPNDGACPSCHSTCKTCSAADSSDKCTSCAAGYYMVGSAAGPCTSCDSNSGSVKGVAGCLNCAPPSSSTGSVLCYLMNGDSAGGSTNKSGLSTGAIAGISVAVIVVVGGLVGFLCWWFLCRGKA